jgi:hypothetical protein
VTNLVSPELVRGCVFGAEHDRSFDFWASGESRWKLCVAFNATPPAADDDVHYFMATSQVNFFRERTQLAAEAVIFPANSYPFFPVETVLDFRDLRIAPKAKLQAKGLRVLGHLSDEDISRCVTTIRAARLLENRAKRRLGLLG